VVNLPRLSGARKRLLEMPENSGISLNESIFFNPIMADIHPFVRFPAKIYFPAARWRIE
jgi:hypothetical protein